MSKTHSFSPILPDLSVFFSMIVLVPCVYVLGGGGGHYFLVFKYENIVLNCFIKKIRQTNQSNKKELLTFLLKIEAESSVPDSCSPDLPKK